MAKTREERSAERRAKAEASGSIFAALAEGSRRARTMSEVESFRAVRTGITSFNRASAIGGAPLSCVWVVHGPSHGGKTTFLVDLICSFQRVGGVACMIDVEQAANTRGWLDQLGVDLERCLYVGRTRPEEAVEPLTYEEVVEEVRRVRRRFRDLRVEKRVPWGTPLLIVVDSVSKMVPSGFLERLEKDGNLRSGVGREQANLNAAWMLEVGAEIGSDDVIVALVAHEYEKATASSWVGGYKVRGGDAMIYDSMMVVRSVFAGQVYDAASDGAPAVGKRHRLKITKNKHGPPFREACFYTASGDGEVSAGFDRGREAVTEALVRGVMEGPDPSKRGFSLTLGTKLKWGRRALTLKQVLRDGSLVEELRESLDGSAREENRKVVGKGGGDGE